MKILKFYYNLSYGLLPSYFNYYLDVLNVNTTCGGISSDQVHDPKSDCLEQDSYLQNYVYYNHLIELINCTHTNNPQILKKYMKKHKLILDSTSISQGSTYLHIPINTTYPITLDVDIFRTSAIIKKIFY